MLFRYYVQNMRLYHENPRLTDEEPEADYSRAPLAEFSGWVEFDSTEILAGDNEEETALAKAENCLRRLVGWKFAGGGYGLALYTDLRRETGAQLMERVGVRPLFEVAS